MSPRRGGRRDRGAGHTQPEKQPAVQTANPTIPVTQADLASMEHKITWEQFKESFYAKFFSANLKYAKQQEFLNLEQVKDEATRTETFIRGLRLDLQGTVRALRPTTHADALRLALNLSLHEMANPPKAAERETPSATSSGACCSRENLERATCLSQLLKSTWWSLLVRERGLLQVQEVERVGTVVTGTLPRLGHYAFVLFDFGSSHSFISSIFVQHVCLEVEPLSSVLSVSTPSGKDFDVILGMDWLSANRASIDCSCKEVVFNPPSGPSFKFKGATTVSLPKAISAIKTIMRGYPDIFPDELLGLPPPREIDFAIELEPGIASISRAPYRMAPAELKELKVQLQELLDKGFL
ncbi:ty3-gypsy retrotransposon protein [Cucumis melo var. makuwa]|uniref:Ty3-gypsy retrotransposon protein n=1 Tax=Cucumis melo var. makuwa TaxID=1194695 RepID=A0A5D3C341_CUCMM|nr:ty3-gypsy retrotransposon protein [Cucumis melo var. makuwa]